ncbi:DMT family transporter [Leisingera sp. SS27]|uniref:DMT family transporter n=1 Tax=Leisingera sp. SS27 TaxID=2979462 RepID=UPI00232B6A6C|nr:DMT family transporter [Leisingera sp. SS27]MDC0660095.1 DMT family transporter [Leisingera sp. SS27]
MHSLVLGLIAALAWGIHDLCVRVVSKKTGILPAMLTVFATGAILMAAAGLALADWPAMTLPVAKLAGLSGAIYALASYALYRAFALGPVRLAAPLIGAYPVLSLGLAMMQGQPVGPGHWLAVAAVVGGVGCIAVFSADDDGGAFNPRTAGWGLMAAIGFALTFATGQAAAQAGAELPVLILTRAAAILLAAALAILLRALQLPPRQVLPLLCVMGALDAAALGLVIYSGTLHRPEFASVSASLFGLVTVVLAWLVLRESMTRAQWISVAVTFGGIAYLGF